MPWTPYLAATSSNGVSINAPMALVQFLYDNVTPTLPGLSSAGSKQGSQAVIVLVARSLKKLKSSLFLLVLASVVVIIVVVLFAYCYITIIRGLSKEEEDAV